MYKQQTHCIGLCFIAQVFPFFRSYFATKARKAQRFAKGFPSRHFVPFSVFVAKNAFGDFLMNPEIGIELP
jgi:hypothetical protein